MNGYYSGEDMPVASRRQIKKVLWWLAWNLFLVVTGIGVIVAVLTGA